MKVHQGYPCDLCPDVLPTWSALRRHKAEHHCSVNKCLHCGFTTKLKQNLTQHLKVHEDTREETYCPVKGCERSFLLKKNLKQHIRETHNGENIWRGRKKGKEKPVKEKKPKKPQKKRSMAAHWLYLDDREEEEVKVYSRVAQDTAENRVTQDTAENRVTQNTTESCSSSLLLLNGVISPEEHLAKPCSTPPNVCSSIENDDVNQDVSDQTYSQQCEKISELPSPGIA